VTCAPLCSATAIRFSGEDNINERLPELVKSSNSV
jgi:hypothetical protein